MGALSEVHQQHARRYFSERQPNAWNRGRFLNHCRSSTALSETQIGNAYRMILHEIKMGAEKQEAARARELLLEEKRRQQRVDLKQQKKQDMIFQVGNFVAGDVQGGHVIASGHTATQTQTYTRKSPQPDFTEFDGISSGSDMPPTEILSSFPASTQSSGESFRPAASLGSYAKTPSAPRRADSNSNATGCNVSETNPTSPAGAETTTPESNPTRITADKSNAERTNVAEANAEKHDTPRVYVPTVDPGEHSLRTGNQERLRIEILELDVEFLKKRNGKLEERIDDLMKIIAAMEQRLNCR